MTSLVPTAIACIRWTILGWLMVMLLRVSAQIIGYTPDIDYPIYAEVPRGLSFTCMDKLPGYYADVETRCQVWHWCLHSGVKFSFLCPNGTVFNQAVRVCDWWFQVDCPSAVEQYANNEELYVVPNLV